MHDYLDALTETLGNLSKHEEDLDEVRSVLQDVYEAFVDLGITSHDPLLSYHMWSDQCSHDE